MLIQKNANFHRGIKVVANIMEIYFDNVVVVVAETKYIDYFMCRIMFKCIGQSRTCDCLN
jgi:hypothetical protein